jgi:hypothetical protein
VVNVDKKTTHIAGRKMRHGFELYFDLGGINIEKEAELWRIVVGDKEKVEACRARRRSFDCASRDETARGSAQDDTFYINPSLSLRL